MNIEADHQAPASAQPRSSTGWHRILRFASRAAIVVIFFGLLYIGISHVLKGRLWLTSAAFTGAAMCIPLVDASSTLGQRLKWSLMMPFAAAGLVVSVFVYIQLFRMDWFEAIFNDMGAGPLGMMVFALLGLVLGGYAGVRCVTAIESMWSARGGTAGPPQDGDDVAPAPDAEDIYGEGPQ